MNMKNIRLQVKPARQYKDRVFRMIYRDKESFLELYNALNGTSYSNSEDLIVTTLESAIYLGMKNDVSYLVYDELTVYEHQSTRNPNMPLRDLLYVAHIYSELTKNADIFSSKLIKIPAPQFVVFYNGVDEAPEQYVQKLSDAYEHLTGEPALELKVTVLNINYGYNKELMDKCKSLRDYSIFVAKSRKYSRHMDLEEAIDLAITECIHEDVMAELLHKHRAEVISMSLFEFNEELHERSLKELGREEGETLAQFRLVRKKMNKGMTVEEIADVLEQEKANIQKLYDILLKNPDASETELLACLNSLHEKMR